MGSDHDNSQGNKPLSPVALRLARLKQSVLRATAARERLPQPLFWSLFHGELESLKESRREERARRAQLYDCEWLES